MTATNPMFRILDELEDDEGFRGTVMAIGHIGSLEEETFELTYKLRDAWGNEEVKREGLLGYVDGRPECVLSIQATLYLTCRDGEVVSMQITPSLDAPTVTDAVGAPDHYTWGGLQMALKAFHDNIPWVPLKDLPDTITWEA